MNASRARAASVVLGALLLVANAVVACKRSAAPSPKPSASAASAKPSASTPPAEARAVEARPPTPVAPCRALRVDGDVELESGAKLATLGPLDGKSWLNVGEKSLVVVRHAESAREFSVAGPGRVLPCRNGLEQVVLARGKFLSSKGTGVRPGAELWIATPFGVLRYGDAELEITVSANELRARTRAGTASVDAASGLSGAAPDGTLAAGSLAKKRGRPEPSALVTACEGAAEQAKTSAERVASASTAELGRLTAEQMRDRRDARARCLTAESAVATLDSVEDRARLGDQLRRAEATWRGVPRGGGSTRPEPAFRGPE